MASIVIRKVPLMPRRKTTVHSELKQWLLELGLRSGYDESYSGDSEAIDVRVGEKHIEYHPDVIWNWKGSLYFIELAFSEDWRAIAGEMLLASIVKNCKEFYMITIGEPDFTNSLLKIIGNKIDFKKWVSYTFETSDLNDVEKMKRGIRNHLKQMNWIK
jgi:hypothetical protein